MTDHEHDWIKTGRWFTCQLCLDTNHPASCYDEEGIRDCSCGLDWLHEYQIEIASDEARDRVTKFTQNRLAPNHG